MNSNLSPLEYYEGEQSQNTGRDTTSPPSPETSIQPPPPPSTSIRQPFPPDSVPSTQSEKHTCHSPSPTSPLEPTQPKGLPEPHGTTAAQPDPERIERVIKKALQLEIKFVRVLTHTRVEFSRKPVQFLDELRATLITLPVSSAFKHLKFLRKEKQRIQNATSTDEIFEILDDHWVYTDYELLQHIVQEFGESALKKEMSDYVEALERFEKETTIQDNSTAASESRYPKGHVCGGYVFSTVNLQLPKDPAVCTLYEVRQLSERLQKSACLMPYVLKKEAQPGSVIVTLVFPRTALELIIPALYREFPSTHQAVTVTIDKKLLKEYNEEYVKVCPINGLQAFMSLFPCVRPCCDMHGCTV